MKNVKNILIGIVLILLITIAFFKFKPLVINRFIQNDANNFTINKYPFEMVFVKGGVFNYPNNKQTIAIADFYLQSTELTQAQWQAIMGYNSSYFRGSTLPVENVSWDSVQVFIKQLNKLTHRQYRLPTASEWEYAAGGGSTNRSQYAGTNNATNLEDYAVFLEHRPLPISFGGRHWGIYGWFQKNIYGGTRSVAHKQPNQLGLFDMSGNVNEWCVDSIANENGYSERLKLVKGGSFADTYFFCRVEGSNKWYANKGSWWVGFRLAMDK